MMADLIADTCNEMIIEFVPKKDAKVQLLLSHREDIFDWYHVDHFIESFKTRFNPIKGHRFLNNRILLHFTNKKNEN